MLVRIERMWAASACDAGHGVAFAQAQLVALLRAAREGSLVGAVAEAGAAQEGGAVDDSFLFFEDRGGRTGSHFADDVASDAASSDGSEGDSEDEGRAGVDIAALLQQRRAQDSGSDSDEGGASEDEEGSE